MHNPGDVALPLQSEHAAHAGVRHRFDGRVRHRRKLEEGGRGAAVWPKSAHGRLVAHLVAIVGRRENRDAFATVLNNVTLLLYLMRPDQHFQSVVCKEASRDVRPEGLADATLGGAAAGEGLRVRP